MNATLFRKNGPAWRFGWSTEYLLFMHKTRYGRTYAIIMDREPYKPIWIGQLCANAWITCEKDIGAVSIQFDEAGEYFFPE